LRPVMLTKTDPEVGAFPGAIIVFREVS